MPERKASLGVEESAERPAVTTYDRNGKAMQAKVGTLSEDGTRCRIRFEGLWVDATQENGRWVYRPPVEATDEG
jgi:hypothetical protein